MQNKNFIQKLYLQSQQIILALCCSHSLRRHSLIGILTIAAIVPPSPADAALLTKWQFSTTANQLEVTVNDETKPRYFLMAKPARIVLDLPNTTIGAVETQQTYSGAIRQIRVSQFQPDQTRIVLELGPDVVLAPGQVQLQKVGQRWILRPLIVGATTGTPQAVPTTPRATTKPITPTTTKPSTSVTPKPVIEEPPPPTPSSVSDSSLPAPVQATTVIEGPFMVIPPATSPSNQAIVINVPLPDQVTTAQPAPATASAPTAVPTTTSLPALNSPPPAATTPEADILPPAIFPNKSTVMVRVPPLQSAATANLPSLTAPPTANVAAPVQPAPKPEIKIPIVEFGQPLPKAISGTPQPASQKIQKLPPLEPGAIILPIEGPTPFNSQSN